MALRFAPLHSDPVESDAPDAPPADLDPEAEFIAAIGRVERSLNGVVTVALARQRNRDDFSIGPDLMSKVRDAALAIDRAVAVYCARRSRPASEDMAALAGVILRLIPEDGLDAEGVAGLQRLTESALAKAESRL